MLSSMETVFGWPLRVTEQSKHNSLLNYPMQANGAEMMRLAAIFATDAGIEVCAPVHDALLIEADIDDLPEHIALTRAAMAEASRLVLDGLEVVTDVDVTVYPDHYTDPRGEVMWNKVCDLLDL
jgi:DNA polymerase-1